MLYLIVAFLLGIPIGMIASSLIAYWHDYKFHGGKLHINDSDIDGPFMYLELPSDMDDITKNKYITFRVVIDKTRD